MIHITRDTKLRDEIKAGLTSNGGYCPCKIERIPENKCMCQEFMLAVKNGEEGPCHCGLWVFQKGTEEK